MLTIEKKRFLPGLDEPLYLFPNQPDFMYSTKGFLSGILLLLAMASGAQFKKGDKMMGTSIGSIFLNSGAADVSFPQVRGYSSQSKSYGLRLEPIVGWFISEKTVIGAGLNINPSGQKVTYKDLGTIFQKDQSTNFNIGIGGFVRNYFSGNNTFMPFGHFGFNAGISSSTTEGFKYYTASPNYKVTYDGKSSGGFFANATLQLGLTKMLGDYTGLDIYLGYNYSYSKSTFKTTTLTDLNIDGTIDTRAENQPTTKFTNHGIIVGVGFQVFLKGKKK